MRARPPYELRPATGRRDPASSGPASTPQCNGSTTPAPETTRPTSPTPTPRAARPPCRRAAGRARVTAAHRRCPPAGEDGVQQVTRDCSYCMGGQPRIVAAAVPVGGGSRVGGRQRRRPRPRPARHSGRQPHLRRIAPRDDHLGQNRPWRPRAQPQWVTPPEYGLGLAHIQLAGQDAWGHPGGITGFHAEAWYLPKTGVTIVALANLEASPAVARNQDQIARDLAAVVRPGA